MLVLLLAVVMQMATVHADRFTSVYSLPGSSSTIKYSQARWDFKSSSPRSTTVTAVPGMWDDVLGDITQVPDGIIAGPWYFMFDWGPYERVTVNDIDRTDWTYFSGNVIMFQEAALTTGDVVKVYSN